MRWIVEGVWRGYRASQSRACHRRIVTNKREASQLSMIHAVCFTDNTTMEITVREAKPREKVQEIRGYDSLLADFRYKGMTGYCRVSDLRELTTEKGDSGEGPIPTQPDAENQMVDDKKLVPVDQTKEKV